MKRLLGIAAATGLLAAAPAFAGVDVFVNFNSPAPAFTPAPVYVAPAPVRYYGEPRWHERHHFYHHDYRDRRFYRDYRHDRY